MSDIDKVLEHLAEARQAIEKLRGAAWQTKDTATEVHATVHKAAVRSNALPGGGYVWVLESKSQETVRDMERVCHTVETVMNKAESATKFLRDLREKTEKVDHAR